MKRKMVSAMVLTWLVALLFCALADVASAVPQLMNYQGRLNDNAGTPVNGPKTFVFSLYSSATATTALWTETQTVIVSNGVFNAIFGSTTPMPAAVFDNVEVWLGIAVSTDAEMTPRLRITSVGYSIKAVKSDSVADGAITDASVAPGAAISYSKLNHPDSDHAGAYYSKAQVDALLAAQAARIGALESLLANFKYTVTYNGNGNMGGSVPIDTTNYVQGQTVTVLGNTGGLAKTGCYFLGWNTQADGNGTNYTQGQTFTIISANVTLYAKWTANSTFAVIYNGNGNMGGSVPIDTTNYVQGQTVTVLGNTGSLAKTGYSFLGWNTQADGSGTTYGQGATFTMGSANYNMYAIWAATAKSITAFSILGVAGTIDENAKTISVTLPYGTDTSSLVATFVTMGVSVRVGSVVQESGVTANDISGPAGSFVYEVTAADGSTQAYSVTVDITAPSQNKSIDMVHIFHPDGATLVEYANATVVIDPATKTIYVTGILSNSEYVVFNFTGVSLTLPNGTVKNGPFAIVGSFISSIAGDYIVEAEDGTKVTYSVIVVAV